MSFLPSLFLLCQFPACRASHHFHCTGFASCLASTMWAFTKLDLVSAFTKCLVSASLGPSWGCFNQVKYKSRHQICWGSVSFPQSVSPQQRFEMVDQCYRSVTVRFIQQAKDSTPLRHKGVLNPKGERLNPSWLPHFIHLSPPSWAYPMQIGLAKKGTCLFHLKFSLWSMDFLLFHCSIFRGFSLSLSFSHCHFWLLFWSEVLILMRVIY